MKSIVTWIGKRILSATVTAVFFVVAVLGVVYAFSYPETPEGGVPGGKFMTYFTNMR